MRHGDPPRLREAKWPFNATGTVALKTLIAHKFRRNIIPLSPEQLIQTHHLDKRIQNL